MKKVWLVGSLVLLAGCGPDIGQCIPPDQAAMMDKRYQLIPTAMDDGIITYAEYTWPGQDVIYSSCSSGRCHSAKAVGVNRYGAPAGLDFDVPTSLAFQSSTSIWITGHKNVQENADAMWAEIYAGTMPPPDDLIPDKEAARNWLACGAPASLPMPAPNDSFEGIYAILSSSCLGCHNDAAVMGGLSLGADMCTAYDRLVGQPSFSGGACAGGTYVVRQNPDASLLLGKVSANPPCGSVMPLGGPALGIPAITAIQTWIANDAPKPQSCM